MTHCWWRLRLHVYGDWERPGGCLKPRRYCTECGHRQYGTDYTFGMPPQTPTMTDIRRLEQRIEQLEGQR